jgi:Calcineurin-like phosphoesterase
VTTVAFLTDVEGSFVRFASFFDRQDFVHLLDVDSQDERIDVEPGAVFVFGGDAIDRGPWSRRIVRLLLDVKRRCPERVVLLAGNRDINKLRIPRELSSVLPKRAPPEATSWTAVHRLQHILSMTMGAQDAFAHRATELRAERRDHGDDDVVQSFLDDLVPNSGSLFHYLEQCQLAYQLQGTLFVHGGIDDESLGYVPSGATTSSLSTWIAHLNAFFAAQITAYARHPIGVDEPAWMPIIQYQAPREGGRNRQSVVYGRFGDDPWNNPGLPSATAVRWLTTQGIHRVVVGHTPVGDLPAILRTDDNALEVVIADNSRSRVETCNVLTLTDSALVVRGRTVLDDGTEIDVEQTLPRATSILPVGSMLPSGDVVKAVIDGQCLLFRFEDKFAIRQTRQPT